MKKFIAIYFILLTVTLSGCDFLDGLTDPNYGSPFGYNNRVTYKGYTYTNNYGNSVNDRYITFTGIGSTGYINGENAYGIIDSTFSYSHNYGIGSLRHTDTLYFSEDYSGNIKFLSYGYYRIIPRWIDLITIADTNRYTYQNYDETINGQRWKLQIRNHLTFTQVYTGFGSFPAYRLEQYLDYDAPYSTTLTIVWYWNVNYGLMIYDERRSGLIYQVADEKNF